MFNVCIHGAKDNCKRCRKNKKATEIANFNLLKIQEFNVQEEQELKK